MLTHTEIGKILNWEVRSAEATLKYARRNLDAIKGESPSLLEPDGNNRITGVLMEHVKAREAFQKAVKRNVAFTLNGIIPEDLRED